MALFRNNDNFFDSTCSLSDHRLSAIIAASIFYLICLTDEAGRRKFQVNEKVRIFLSWFAGFESSCVSLWTWYLILTFLSLNNV